jgi:uncharacterized membrane protein SpoIIM required for sporulation
MGEELFLNNGLNPAYIVRLYGVFGKWSKPNYNTVVATFCYNVAHGLPLQINELIVTEFSAYYRMPNYKMKWLSDLAMLLLSVVLALVLHGDLTGVGIGTIIITAFNAALIGLFGKLLDKCFTFEPRFPRLVRLLGLNDRVNT